MCHRFVPEVKLLKVLMKVTPTFALLITLTGVVRAQTPKDRYPFVRGDKVGFIDYQGREVIPPRFSNAGDTAHFDNGQIGRASCRERV